MAKTGSSTSSTRKKEKVGKVIGASAFDSAVAGTAPVISTEAMLPEQTDAGAEILQAQEGAGAEVVVQVQQTERIKPAMLSIAADDQRKKDLEIAFGKSKRDGRRMNLIAGHNFVSEHFAERDADSVSLDEYVSYRDIAFAALPIEAGDFQFTQDANNFVRSRGQDMEAAICEVFRGRYNVTLGDIQEKATWERILMKQAEFYVASRPKGKKAVRIDAEASVGCQSSEKCNRQFVPLAWLEYDREKQQEHWTGNILITKDGETKWFCPSCRLEGRKYGVPFFSARSAANVADRAREKSMVKDGVRATLQEAIGYRQQQQNDGRPDNRKQAGKFDPMQEARCRNSFSALLNNRDKDHSTGRYYSPEFDWNDKRSGRSTKTFIDLDVRRDSLVVTNAGPGLEALIGTSHNTGFFENKGLFAAINMAAVAQQKD